MTHFFASGEKFNVASDAAIVIYDKLPTGNYLVKIDPFENLYLEAVESFSIPERLYGNTSELTKKILTTYHSRDQSTGVLLTGEKGSGKTLLAKNISKIAAENEIPTIIVNSDWHGDKFNKLLQDINQDCIVLFDEFEKVYNSKEQQAILTLMDGVFPTKKLFILTVNDKWAVDSHMRNRPGRLFYCIEYKGVDSEFVTEYCNENLKEELLTHVSKIVRLSAMFENFTFDILKALVEEMNRFDETPEQALKYLNASPEGEVNTQYNVKIFKVGVEQKVVYGSVFTGSPLQRGHAVELENNDYNYSPSDLVEIDLLNGKYHYKVDDVDIFLTKVQKKYFSPMDYL